MKMKDLRNFSYQGTNGVSIFSYLLRSGSPVDLHGLCIIYDSIDNEKFIARLREKYIKPEYDSELIHKIYNILKLKLTKEEENARINLLLIES